MNNPDKRHLPNMYTLVVTMNWNRFRNSFRIRFCIFYNRSELSHWLISVQRSVMVSAIGLYTRLLTSWMYSKNKAFRFDLCTFVLSSKLSCSKANKELCHTGSMTYTPSKQYQWVSPNIDDHILLSFFIVPMNEKSASISVYMENKTTKIRLSPCVHYSAYHILHGHLSLSMNVNFIRQWRMLSHLCRIRVLCFPLKQKTTTVFLGLWFSHLKGMFNILKSSFWLNLL